MVYCALYFESIFQAKTGFSTFFPKESRGVKFTFYSSRFDNICKLSRLEKERHQFSTVTPHQKQHVENHLKASVFNKFFIRRQHPHPLSLAALASSLEGGAIGNFL